jgi:F0F1-type ATP synthase delta subunit
MINTSLIITDDSDLMQKVKVGNFIALYSLDNLTEEQFSKLTEMIDKYCDNCFEINYKESK